MPLRRLNHVFVYIFPQFLSLFALAAIFSFVFYFCWELTRQLNYFPASLLCCCILSNWISRQAFWKVCWPNWDWTNRSKKSSRWISIFTLFKCKRKLCIKTFKRLFCIVRYNTVGARVPFRWVWISVLSRRRYTQRKFIETQKVTKKVTYLSEKWKRWV